MKTAEALSRVTSRILVPGRNNLGYANRGFYIHHGFIRACSTWAKKLRPDLQFSVARLESQKPRVALIGNFLFIQDAGNSLQ